MKRSFITGVVVASALAVPAAGLGATAATAAPAKPAASNRTVQAKATVAAIPAPYRKGTKAYSKWYAKQYMAARYGWGTSQYKSIVKLWNHESGWSHKSMNGSSGAFGIPQSLPGRKMASAGKDWRTNPETQIRWGLGYVKGRYGTPNKAWSHFRSHNWY